ncbi:Smr domain-containing protein [Mycena indigotica]|uniref:Smr domain-containing protein n=1 Tax=Mycena indigotica TaxID=2126181 RepID=A0A8H6WE61_9AGAR|nr:Smr domain-containing protein [Mycena indigotica]KAF7315389.1 Smr domain-containing protein [Mycena indigotica]
MSLVLLSLVLGFGLRVFLLSLGIPFGSAAFIGVFEGVGLYRTLLTEPLVDSLLLCGLRLGFDLVFTTLHALTLLSTLALSFVLSDTASRTQPEDVRRIRRRTLRYLRSLGQTVVESDYWKKRKSVTIEDAADDVSDDDEELDQPPVASPRSPRSPRVSRSSRSTRPAIPALQVAAAPSNVSHGDELLTPSSLAASYTNRSPPIFNLPDDDIIEEESDELQTPLELNIVGLPPANNITISLVREPSDEHLETAALREPPPIPPEPDVLSPGTEFSELSNVEAKAIFANAENMRKEARDTEEEKRKLDLQLKKAVKEKRTKDAFLLRRDIELLEEKIKKLHAGAARRYYRSGNLSGSDDVPVDVHGLFIPEAVKIVETALHEALKAGRSEIKVIVGKGKHSKDGKAKLRPAIMEEMEKQGIVCRVQDNNTGMLVLTVPS